MRAIKSTVLLLFFSMASFNANSLGIEMFTAEGYTPPANNTFDDAETIDGNGERSGVIDFNNSISSPLLEQPSDGSPLWWKWTAPSDGLMDMDTCGSSVKSTSLTAYIGNREASLVPVAYDEGFYELTSNFDDWCYPEHYLSRVRWQAKAGITYYIYMPGFDLDEGGDPDHHVGHIRLNWSFTGSGTSNTPISVSPENGLSFDGPYLPAAPTSARTFVPSIDIHGAEYIPLIAPRNLSNMYTVTNNSNRLQQIDLQIPDWLSANPASFSLSPGDSQTVEFQLSASISDLPAGNYIGAIDFGHIARTVSLQRQTGSLSNDNFADAITLSDGNQSIQWNSDQAGLENNEAEIVEISPGQSSITRTGGKSVWWKWTPNKTASVTIDTSHRNFLALIALYTGTQADSLIQIANDSFRYSSDVIKTTLEAGTTYYLKVDGHEGASGDFQLNIRYNSEITSNDFNGDKLTDIFWRNSANGVNWLWSMDHNNVSKTSSVRNLGPAWKVAAQGDFDGDGNTDTLWRNPATGKNWMWLMSKGKVQRSVPVRTISREWQEVYAGDFNQDGKADLFWRNPVTGQNWMWWMDENSVTRSEAVDAIPAEWKVGVLGDFNDNRVTDILWRNSEGGQNLIWFMKGFREIGISNIEQTRTINPEWQLASQGDFNADGKTDLFWRNSRTGTNLIWLMDANTVTRSFPTRRLPDTNWNVVAQGDYNNDGFSDILWRNNQTGMNWMWMMAHDRVIQSSQVRALRDTNWNPVDTRK